MSKRRWICIPCRKAYVRKQSLTLVECPSCHGPCEVLHWSTRVPSPKQTKAWEKFVAEHEQSKAGMEALDRARAERERAETKKSTPRIKNPVAEVHIPYVQAICTPLIETLNHAAALPVNLLAGHAANLAFWVGETRHRLAVIDGYQERFDRLRVGQAEYEREHQEQFDRLRASQAEYEREYGVVTKGRPIRRGTKDHDRHELRRAICESIERLLNRCHQERLLSEKALRAYLAAIAKPRIAPS